MSKWGMSQRDGKYNEPNRSDKGKTNKQANQQTLSQIKIPSLCPSVDMI